MNIDLELYRVFYEVVKYKNITKTAENMHISQSAITQSIQKLEKLLGGKVFYRNKNGVELTEEGKRLYEYIRNSIETMSNAEKIFSQNINLESGRIRIGGGDTQIATLIINPLIKFSKKYPNIKLYITSGKTDELIQKLSNGELDIITTRKNPFDVKNYANIEFIPLRKSTYSFFASKQYVKNNNIKEFKDIVDKDIITPKPTTVKNDIFEECCKNEGINLNRKYEVSTSFITKELVLNDLGIGFVDSKRLEDIKEKIVILKEVESKESIEGIATLNKKMCNKATLELVKYIKEDN